MADEMTSKTPTPAEKERLRTGKCAVGCGCDQYAHDRIFDRFRTCICGHTQWGHHRPEATA